MISRKLFGYKNFNDANIIHVLREKDIEPILLQDILRIMILADTEDPLEFFSSAKIGFLTEEHIFAKLLLALASYSGPITQIPCEIVLSSTFSLETNIKTLKEACTHHKNIKVYWEFGEQQDTARNIIWASVGLSFLNTRNIEEFWV